MSAGTCTARILERTRVAPGPAGSRFFWARPDLLLGHEATVALLMDRMHAAGASVRYPERCLFAADHFVPPATSERAGILRRYTDFLTEHHLDTSALYTGISHQILLEDTRLVPGLFVAGADSHTTMAGALGAAGCGFGSTDMLLAYSTGRVLVCIPEVLALDLHGQPAPALGSRDPALALMCIFGQGGLAWKALEVFDHSPQGLPVSWRASVANQAVDAGAKACIFVPDATTAAYIEARDGHPCDRSAWVLPAADADYTARYDLDLGSLEPLLACPPDPSAVVAVRAAARRSIHQAFVGSCAGGRLCDLVEAAGILRGRHVAPGVRLVVTPASRKVWLAALRAGLLETLTEAGAMVTSSSCGACGGIDKGLLCAGEVCVSTSNRNFRGRMGDPDAEIYLASARTVAASAITGRITDPREILS